MHTVIIVDDHKIFRDGISMMLPAIGAYTVVGSCNNGQEVIQMLQTVPAPDIVLLDITMPVMDGYETACWLRQHHPKTKVIAMFMDEQSRFATKMMDAGCSDIVHKTATPDEWRNHLNTLMEITQGSVVYHIPEWLKRFLD